MREAEDGDRSSRAAGQRQESGSRNGNIENQAIQLPQNEEVLMGLDGVTENEANKTG